MIRALILFVFSLATCDAIGHYKDGSNYSGHDASLCPYADGSSAGSVSCSDPAANPCYSGRSTSAHTPNVGSHGHAGFPDGKENTAACIAYQRANPRATHCDDRHCVDPEDSRVFWEHGAADHACSVCVGGKCGWWGTEEARHRHDGLCPDETCAHGDACDGYGAHQTSDHDCAVCDDQNGTCGWHSGHRHPGQCPPVDPPVDPEVDELGCHDNPPHPYHSGCPGPNVLPGHDCASADFHKHEDAFENECHSDSFEHGVVGRNPHWADHESWGEHESEEHDCGNCDERDGTCGWANNHRHPGMCPNAPDDEGEDEGGDDEEEGEEGSEEGGEGEVEGDEGEGETEGPDEGERGGEDEGEDEGEAPAGEVPDVPNRNGVNSALWYYYT